MYSGIITISDYILTDINIGTGTILYPQLTLFPNTNLYPQDYLTGIITTTVLYNATITMG